MRGCVNVADRVRMTILPAVFIDNKVLFIPKPLLLTNLQSVSPASATDRLCAAKFMSDLCGGEKCNYTYYHLPSPLRSAPLKPTPRMWGGTRMGPGMPSYMEQDKSHAIQFCLTTLHVVYN